MRQNMQHYEDYRMNSKFDDDISRLLYDDDRTPRSVETREVEQRKTDSWIPQSALPTPEERDGYVHRWVRTAMMGTADIANVSQKFREGWEPCVRSDYPELTSIMSDLNSQFADNFEIGGLLLCRAPRELIESRAAYYDRLATQQIDSVDNTYMKENDPRMPLLQPERKSRTSFGRD